MQIRVRSLVVGAIAAVVGLGTGIGIGLAVAPTPAPPPRVGLPLCPSIATIEAGGTFNVNGCTYSVDTVLLTHPTVIDGGTWSNPSTTPLHPIFEIRFTDSVTIEDADINGANIGPDLHSSYVAEAGIDVLDSTNVTLANDDISEVYGDCLEFWAVPPKHYGPNTINGAALNLNNCGRNGVTPANVKDTILDGVTIGNVGQVAVGFESDLASLLQSFTMNNSTVKGVEVSERPLGPVTFNNDTIRGGQIQFLGGLNNTTPWAIAPTFNGGSFVGTTKAVPAIILRGLSKAVFNHTSLMVGGRGPLTSVQTGSVLTINP